MADSPGQQAGATSTGETQTAPSAGDRIGTAIALVLQLFLTPFAYAAVAFGSMGQCVDSCNDSLTMVGAVGGIGIHAAGWVITIVVAVIALGGKARRPMAPWAWGALALPVLGAVFAVAMGGIAAG